MSDEVAVDWAGLVARKGLSQPFPMPWWQGRNFQLAARSKLARNKRVILSLDKGLGKTSVILSIFEDALVHKDVPGFTVLILTTGRGMGSYIRDIQKFPEFEGKICIIEGNKVQRERLWRYSNAKYFICKYNTFLSDCGKFKQGVDAEDKTRFTSSIVPKWVLDGSVDGIVCDEFHRVFRRHKSAIFELLKKVAETTEYFFPMSGSAISKGPEDLWAALHLCDPKFWSSYWRYVYTWCEMDDTGFGKTILGPKMDRTDKWQNAVEPYMFHCTKAMAAGSTPPKVRDILEVELEPWQRQLVDGLWTELFAETPDGEFIFAGNSLTKLFKVRTALICPKVLSPSYGYGAALEGIWDEIEEGELSRFAIFTPFRAPIPYIQTFLEEHGCHVCVLQGGIDADEQENRLGLWRRQNASASRPAAVLSTIKYAESWEIPECSYGYLLGREWDPEENKQAEDRLHRLISEEQVNIWYTKCKNTYDEDSIQSLLDKSANRRAMFRSYGQFKNALGGSKDTC